MRSWMVTKLQYEICDGCSAEERIECKDRHVTEGDDQATAEKAGGGEADVPRGTPEAKGVRPRSRRERFGYQHRVDRPSH